MGTRGPISRPEAQVRQLPAGGRRRRGTKAAHWVEPVGRDIRAPSHLGQEGRRAFQQAFKECRSWISEADLLVVTRYAQAHDERAALRDIIATEGRFSRGSSDQQVTHPGIYQLAKCEALLVRYEAILGIGAQNKARMHIAFEELRATPPPKPSSKPKGRQKAPAGWHWTADGKSIERNE